MVAGGQERGGRTEQFGKWCKLELAAQAGCSSSWASQDGKEGGKKRLPIFGRTAATSGKRQPRVG